MAPCKSPMWEISRGVYLLKDSDPFPNEIAEAVNGGVMSFVYYTVPVVCRHSITSRTLSKPNTYIRDGHLVPHNPPVSTTG